ncbi:MAG: hypothetical protein CM1200mP22_15420 [Dehalococcoidia bacterium]|nr:MAG: hypothetical protein CM1200mP22_15420 [Dehalococcoidia bacterium]
MGRIPAATERPFPRDQTAEFDELLAGAGSVPLVGPGSIFWQFPPAQQGSNDPESIPTKRLISFR